MARTNSRLLHLLVLFSTFLLSLSLHLPSDPELSPRDLSASISRRVLDNIDHTNANQINCYVEKQLEKKGVNDLCPSDRWPTAVKEKLETRKIAIGTPAEPLHVAGLTGCTVVVAVSKKAVWMAHMWEVPGFSKGGPWSSDRFDPEVIDFIKQGTPTIKDQSDLKDSPLPAVVKISDSKDDLAGADVFIVAPMRRNSKDGSFNYPSKVPKVKDALKGELPNDVKFHDVAYVRPEDGDVVQVLFEYDPRAPKKVVRLFLTGHMVFEGEPGGKIDTHPPAK